MILILGDLQSACGVCIRTGSYCDPTQVQGLAHLLEHSESIVFLYPLKYICCVHAVHVHVWEVHVHIRLSHCVKTHYWVTTDTTLIYVYMYDSVNHSRSFQCTCTIFIWWDHLYVFDRVKRLCFVLPVFDCAVVFMGSEKYPEENAFDAFTSEHGGDSNASTDYERVRTCHMFSHMEWLLYGSQEFQQRAIHVLVVSRLV